VRLFTVGQAQVRIDSVEIDAASDDLFVITSVTVDGQPVLDPDPALRRAARRGGLARGHCASSRRGSTRPCTPGRLRIRHNATGEESLVELTGTAAPDVPVAEQFEQTEGPQASTSCGSSTTAARWPTSRSAWWPTWARFVDFADAQEADYQMAVTVTDGFSTDAGRLERCFPHPAVISGNYPQRQEAFECTFLVGTDGSGSKQGLEAAKRALERAQDPKPEPEHRLSAGRRRPRDRGHERRGRPVPEHARDRGLPRHGQGPRPRLAHQGPRHRGADPTEPCGSGGGFFSAAPGFRYERVAENTGGLFFNICTDDWTPIFDRLGLDTFQAFDTWYLSQPADPSSLNVFVDGVPIPENPTAGFTYQFQENAVRFHGDAVPGPGARIEVRYQNQCTP
jgi:hypothetical protein